MKRILVTAFIAPLGLLACNAWAGSTVSAEINPPVPSVRVHYDDLNLAQEGGAHELMDRITYAARKACGPMPEATEFHMMDKWDDCVNDAFVRAVKYVNVPKLYEVAGIADPHQPTNVAKAASPTTVAKAN